MNAVIPLIACLAAVVYAERTPEDRVMASGSLVDFINPCATKHGGLSKKNSPNGAAKPIWIDGTFAKKDGRFSYANSTVFIRDVVSDDSGYYIWTCSGTADCSTVKLDVRPRLVKVSYLNSFVGYTVGLYRTCLTDRGRFSKDNETLWINGVVAEEKKDKFVYDNRSEVLYLLSYDTRDDGKYIWTCDRPPNWNGTVWLSTLPSSIESASKEVLNNWVIWSSVCVPICILIIIACIISVYYDECCPRKKTRTAPGIVNKDEDLESFLEESPPTYADVTSRVNADEESPAMSRRSSGDVT